MPWYPDRITVEKKLFHIVNSFESFTCQKHKEKGQKLANRAVIYLEFILLITKES